MILLQNIKRIFWLTKSADLNFPELAKVFANRLIYSISRLYYFWKAVASGRDPKVFYNYRRHLPRGVKPKGHCLLAFLAEPIHKEHFIGNVKYYFSNNGAPLCVLKALNELGYVVDVIDYSYKGFVPKRKYDLFFFHQHEIFEALRPKLTNQVVSIMFETTAYCKPMVEKIRKRLLNFKTRHKINLPEAEYNHFFWMAERHVEIEQVSEAADGIIIMGDQLAGSFKALNNPNIMLIKSAVYPDKKFYKDLSVKNLESGRKMFLFFGGGRDVMRKGVDLLLEAFINSPYELYMCIGLSSLFEEIYSISRQKNIHNLGYLKVGSKKFYKIINACNFVIQPAAAEGVPGGVLETMKYGLIPIVSLESNIPEAETCGYLLPDNNLETVSQAISKMSALPAEVLRQKALNSINVAYSAYSPRIFTDDIKSAITQIVNSKK